MNVAVLTLTRDRLPYTQHCFQTLRENAGCEFDHYVLDQGSTDGTAEWLHAGRGGFMEGQGPGRWWSYSTLMPENIGCCRGWNTLLRNAQNSRYDVYVCFDNDCEVVTPNTLRDVAQLAVDSGWILAPRVDGLMHPPPAIGHHDLLGRTVEETAILGNIFMAIPAHILNEWGFRWDERYAVWDGGESITQWYRDRGGHCGYVPGYRVNHYKTTLGQVADIPEYFERRVLEGGRAQ